MRIALAAMVVAGGLKLEPAKAPRDFVVIDRAERPSAN
jgi:uncharacterized protein (TIGR03435 family)